MQKPPCRFERVSQCNAKRPLPHFADQFEGRQYLGCPGQLERAGKRGRAPDYDLFIAARPLTNFRNLNISPKEWAQNPVAESIVQLACKAQVAILDLQRVLKVEKFHLKTVFRDSRPGAFHPPAHCLLLLLKRKGRGLVRIRDFQEWRSIPILAAEVVRRKGALPLTLPA